jgi:hypothetical protein
MTEAHLVVCAAMNFFCFLGFVTAILVITSATPGGGHRAKHRGARHAWSVAAAR